MPFEDEKDSGCLELRSGIDVSVTMISSFCHHFLVSFSAYAC
jgi:hypothetical protein